MTAPNGAFGALDAWEAGPVPAGRFCTGPFPETGICEVKSFSLRIHGCLRGWDYCPLKEFEFVPYPTRDKEFAVSPSKTSYFFLALSLSLHSSHALATPAQVASTTGAQAQLGKLHATQLSTIEEPMHQATVNAVGSGRADRGGPVQTDPRGSSALDGANENEIALGAEPVAGHNKNAKSKGAEVDGSAAGAQRRVITASSLLGQDVFALDSSVQLGRVNDLVFDANRGVGMVAVVSVGSADLDRVNRLELPPMVGVPMGRFEYVDGQLKLNVSPAEWNSAPAFAPGTWGPSGRRDWLLAIEKAFGSALVPAQLPKSSGLDPYQELFDRQAPVWIEGRVSNLERQELAGGLTHALVATMDGAAAERVLLGPEWFLQKRRTMLSVGDEVVFQAVPSREGDEMLWIAREVAVRESDFRLRDERGRPLWQLEPARCGEPKWAPYFLAELQRAQVYGLDGRFGQLHDIYLELRDCTIVFAEVAASAKDSAMALNVDGDDSPWLLPWEAMRLHNRRDFSIPEDRIRLSAAPRLASAKDLTCADVRARVFAFFGRSAPDYDQLHWMASN